MSKNIWSMGTYLEDAPFSIPFPQEMLNAAQDQYRNNEDARVGRYREMLRPSLGDRNSRTDLIALSVEDLLIADNDLVDMLALELPDLMQVWEARPISMFDCLVPSCCEPIPVRNRMHLLRLIRVQRYLGLRVGAGDLVEFRTLCGMLCEPCGQGLWQSYDEQHRADLCIRKARIAELRKMPFTEYRLTKEWRARRSRVLLRAGNRCELCNASGLLDVHHRTYDRYGDELLSDLIALCRPCHSKYHDVLPEAA